MQDLEHDQSMKELRGTDLIAFIVRFRGTAALCFGTLLLIGMGFGLTGALTGCGLQCDAMGCGPDLVIEFSENGNQSWEAGDWEVALFVNDAPIGHCQITLPTEPNKVSTDCSGELSSIETSSDGGSVSEVTSYDFLSVRETEWPEQPVEVEVLRQGELVSRRDLQPDVQTYYPNGRDCPPECQSAVANYSF